MVWRADAPQGNAAYQIRYEIIPYTSGRVLDLGCGPWKAWPHFISWDNLTEWQELKWKPDIIGDATKLDIIASKSMDAVFSSHLLEHIEDHISALKEWWRVIKIGGYLVLYLPHKDFYPNIGEDGANHAHVHDFIPKDIISIFKENASDWDLVVSEARGGGDEYSFFQVFKRLPSGEGQKYSYMSTRPPKSCGIVRYGGIGDMLQAASLIARLKKDGYHITLYTTPKGQDVLKHDPNIDEFILQDSGQVPNQDLPKFWDVLKEKHDKFINLSESVEGTFLALEGRTNHTWPQPVRHKYMNVNYLEFAYNLAGIQCGQDRPPEPVLFYATDREKRIAAQRRSKILSTILTSDSSHDTTVTSDGGNQNVVTSGESGKVILWALSGSSLHKAWPYMDAVIAEFMLKTKDIHFVLVGDDFCKLLEQGWENEPRVHLRSGEWSIRDTLAFAEVCDLVIGPETSVLNLDNVPRIIFLSHASKENLTKYWENYIAITADGCECYPCHMLHYSFEYCTRDEKTGAAMCQAMIEPPEVMQAMVDMLGIAKEKRAA
jgi:ADP-heptose:LPS heptosyltransferase